MHARPSFPARALTGLLAFAGVALPSLGSATNASAGSPLLANATKPGNDGHPYHWAAPC